MVAIAVMFVLVLAGAVAWSAVQGGDEPPTAVDQDGSQTPQGTTSSSSASPQTGSTQLARTQGARSYSVEIPQGWTEVPSDEPGDQLMLAKARRGVFEAVMTVETRPSIVVPLERLPDVTLKELIARNARPEPVGQPTALTVGGEKAIGYAVKVTRKKQRLLEGQVALHHDNQLFLITFASTPKTYRREAGDFEDVLQSWSWE